MEASIYGYLRHHAPELGARILEMHPPLQSTTDETPAELRTLLRKPLPAQAIAIGGLAKYLKTARAARIVAECGAGKTYMALGLAHVLKANTILVMCPSHIAKKWAREAIKTIPFVRTFLIEDMRNGGDPKQPHGVCEVRLRKGHVVYEGSQHSVPELHQMGRKGWERRYPQPSVFIIPKDKGKLSYFWRHAFLTAKSGPELGGTINPDTGIAIQNANGERLTRLDFDQLKVSEQVERGQSGSKQFSPLWQPTFEYSSEWAKRMLERGNSRSDRCERHRKAHRIAIQALAVPYSSLSVIGEVLDPRRPSGPLGGLGPLPVLHTERRVDVDLEGFEFGMTDQDILQILDGLREKQVAVIEAGTGTGKSTFMPFRLMNPPAGAPFRLSQKGPIVVTEPRRAAAKTVARFVGEELCFKHDSRICSNHIGPGFAVGYQVSGERHWDSACDLIYVTDGTMINWVRDGQLSRIGAVIIDEAHERSENIDIILAQLREQIRTYKHLRVIITSATLDKNFFVEYFGGSERVYHLSVPPKKTFGYGVPLFVGTQIDNDIITNGMNIGSTESGNLVHFGGWNKSGPEQDGYPVEDLQETTRQLQALRCVDSIPFDDWIKRMPSALAKQVVAVAKGTEWGDILGFLPTTVTILEAIDQILEQLASVGLRAQFDVYPLLASTDKSTSDKATAPRSRGEKRKIVVSSNLAETSLTVKGVRYIVDSGLICQPEWDSQLASGSYPKKPHSQSGVRQRWGRVGRDAPGWVFPLYTVEDFLSLPRNTPPGSTQMNLETFYMKLMAAGLDIEKAELPASFRHESVNCDGDALKVIDTFKKESERAKSALRLSGAVDADGHLTEYGRELERFPGTGSEALALMLAEQLACIHEVALALAVLGQGHLMGKRTDNILQIDPEWPAAWRVAAAQRHRGLVIGCCDDLDILLRICSSWQSAEDPLCWCETWWINEKALASA